MSENATRRNNSLEVQFVYYLDCYFHSKNKTDLENIDLSFSDKNITATIRGIPSKEINLK